LSEETAQIEVPAPAKAKKAKSEERTRDEVEDEIDAKLAEQDVQDFINTCTWLRVGATCQPKVFETIEKRKGASRFCQLMKFPTKQSGANGHMYLVVKSLIDPTMRPKIINPEGGGYDIPDGSDDAELIVYLIDYPEEPERAASPLREYDAPGEEIFDHVDDILKKVAELAGTSFYSLGFAKDIW
jgi:hypothetical protein